MSPAAAAGTALRQSAPVAHTRILGVGGARGERAVTNDEIAGPIDSSDEWIRQRTGIATRRRAEPHTTLADLAERAARGALAASGLDASDLDAVLISTVTHFEQTPALAAVIADRIGARPAAAFDISAACAGYCYAIAQADAMVRAGLARHVLVIGAERMSDFIDPTDRSISFLLGDGAGAAIVGASTTPGIGPTVWGSDGSQADAIRQTDSWLALRKDAGDSTPAGIEGVSWPTLRQEGPSVFKWVITQMPRVARRAVEAAGLTLDQLDAFIPHQANLRITDSLVKSLKLPEHVVVARDIVETGNTSAASVPLATERLLREGQVGSGAVALQMGFGAGLVYAAQVVVLP